MGRLGSSRDGKWEKTGLKTGKWEKTGNGTAEKQEKTGKNKKRNGKQETGKNGKKTRNGTVNREGET